MARIQSVVKRWHDVEMSKFVVHDRIESFRLDYEYEIEYEYEF